MALHADRRRGDSHGFAGIGIRMAPFALQLHFPGMLLVTERQRLLGGRLRGLGSGKRGECKECE
jgi:hypothetical protein